MRLWVAVKTVVELLGCIDSGVRMVGQILCHCDIRADHGIELHLVAGAVRVDADCQTQDHCGRAKTDG